MKNPGLDVFTYVRSPSHPLNDPLGDGFDPDSGANSDYVPPAEFGRWRTPGQSLRYPIHQGPPFKPGETPEDVVHGEIVSPEEQDGANRILSGEHESGVPSENPHVEHARQELHTPESASAVHTLSGLLSGVHPSSVSPESMDAAHEYLSRHFSGVRVNPHHGTLEAGSSAGMQLVRRKTNLPAIPERPREEDSYALTNKHGTFESKDPKKLVRAMLAFQILHNELAEKKKKDSDGDLSSTSGLKDFINRRHTPRHDLVPGAVFEPGHGTDENRNGVRGGYVAHDADAPVDWRRDAFGIAYSPGHSINEMLDPVKATKPRPDPYFPGHTFTYSRSMGTGHTIERYGGGAKYFVNRLHPAARGPGFDLPPVPKVKSPAGSTPRKRKSTPPIPPTTSAVKVNDLCPVCVSGYLEPYDSDTHECLNCGSLVKHVGFDKQASRKPSRGGLGRGLKDIQPYEGDPLNLASGGSDNPDNAVPDEDYAHPLADEEVDPEYVGYEAPRRLLDRTSALYDTGLDKEDNLKYFKDSDFRPSVKTMTDRPMFTLKHINDQPHSEDGGDNWDSPAVHAPKNTCETCYLRYGDLYTGPDEHEDEDHDFEPFQKDVGARFSAADADPLDEQLGKHGYFPIHKPGEERAYLAPLPGSPGGYARLTEGVPHPVTGERGWLLTADHVPAQEQWTKGGKPLRQRSVPMDRMTQDPREGKPFRSKLPDPGNRTMADKSILAAGTHPIEDGTLNRAMRDLAARGRNSETYQKVFDTAYEPPRLPPEQGTQRERRMLSSVSPAPAHNPGLSRFVSAS